MIEIKIGERKEANNKRSIDSYRENGVIIVTTIPFFKWSEHPLFLFIYLCQSHKYLAPCLSPISISIISFSTSLAGVWEREGQKKKEIGEDIEIMLVKRINRLKANSNGIEWVGNNHHSRRRKDRYRDLTVSEVGRTA